jgi:hypothetical protein
MTLRYYSQIAVLAVNSAPKPGLMDSVPRGNRVTMPASEPCGRTTETRIEETP